jgi:hypothetical protein
MNAPEISSMDDAIHESGHAVIYARCGFRPTFVSIDPVRGGGETCPEPSSPWHSLNPKQRQLVAQAGSAAECRRNGEPLRWTERGAKDRVVLEIFLAEQDLDWNPNDFTEIDTTLSEPGTWSRVVRLAEVLVVQHYMDNLDAYLTE